MNDVMTSIASPSEIIAMERVERNAWLDMFRVAPTALGVGATARWERAGTYALIAEKGVPGSEFNRCFGLGVDAALTQSDLDTAIAWLDRHAAPNWSIQVPPLEAVGEIGGWLERRGLERAGTGWARFFRGTDSVGEGPAPADLTLRELSPGEGPHFGATIVGGFGFPEMVGLWLAALVGRPGWRIYVAFDHDFPVACGALYIDQGWAWLGCDTTLEEFRGRGAQTALIHRRVADAAAAGADTVTAETGQPAPGLEYSNHSYRNYQKAGFIKAYTRPNYRRV
jgi:hypothetical protein